jgi:F-type H+-transporting ATPase subunit c
LTEKVKIYREKVHQILLFGRRQQKKRREVNMGKKGLIGVLTGALVLGMASMALAADNSAMAAGVWPFFGIAIACGFGIGVAAFGTGLSMGYAINGALVGTARNPEASGKIMTTMIIGLALIESLCIYALLICFILVFKIPDLTPMFEAIVKNFGG